MLVMPSRSASSAVCLMPTSTISCTNTVLIEWVRAWIRLDAPKLSPSKLHTGEVKPRGVMQWGAEYTLLGETPASRARARTKGLNEEPACRPDPPPSLPSARLTFDSFQSVPPTRVRT